MLLIRTTVPSFLARIFFEKTSDTSLQFFRYILIGGLSAILDTAVFFVFSTFFDAHYLVAQTFGFLIGISTNYLLCIAWIFESRFRKTTETSLFLLTGVIGLLLSYFFLWLLIDMLGLTLWDNLAAKILTLIMTLLWNFSSRKLFVFKT